MLCFQLARLARCDRLASFSVNDDSCQKIKKSEKRSANIL